MRGLAVLEEIANRRFASRSCFRAFVCKVSTDENQVKREFEKPYPNRLILLVPVDGFEPPTHALRMRRIDPNRLFSLL